MDSELWKQQAIASEIQSQAKALALEVQSLRDKLKYRIEEVDELKKKNMEAELVKVHEIEELKKQFESHKKNTIVFTKRQAMNNLF